MERRNLTYSLSEEPPYSGIKGFILRYSMPDNQLSKDLATYIDGIISKYGNSPTAPLIPKPSKGERTNQQYGSNGRGDRWKDLPSRKFLLVRDEELPAIIAEAIESKDFRKTLGEAQLRVLTAYEAAVLEGSEIPTFEEIGQRLGMTRENVRIHANKIAHKLNEYNEIDIPVSSRRP